MEFDFKTMKRKEMQRLCKKHGLRANSSNSQMADNLAFFFKNREENKQVKVCLRDSGRIRGKGAESVDGDAEKVLIVLDKEDDEDGLFLRIGGEKHEQIQVGLEGSGAKGENEKEKEKMQWYEENSIIFLDEEDHEPGPALRSANKKSCRSRRVSIVEDISVKRKHNSVLNSFMKITDEAIFSSPVEVSDTGNLASDEFLEKEEQENEEHMQEFVQAEIELSSSQILGSNRSSSSPPCLLLSELQNGQEGYGDKIKGNVDFETASKLSFEEPCQAIECGEDSKANGISGSPKEKTKEIAPLILSERVDVVMEKLFRLRKVLRGEITPPLTDSSSLVEQIPCEKRYPHRKNELISEQEDQVVRTMELTNSVHKDCELNDTNSEVNFPNKIDEIAIASPLNCFQGNQEPWNCMKRNLENDTNTAYGCDFYVRPTGEEPCQDCSVLEFPCVSQGAFAEPEGFFEKVVSQNKEEGICIERRRNSIASCSLIKSKFSNVITDSFGSRCLSESLDTAQYATPKHGEISEMMNLLSHSKLSTALEVEKSVSSSCISKKELNNSPGKDSQCFSEILGDHFLIEQKYATDLNEDPLDCSLSRTDTFASANPSESNVSQSPSQC